MTIAILSHAACLDHDTGPGHPERIDRLKAVLHALDEGTFPDALREEAPRATVDQIRKVHTADYVDSLLGLSIGAGEQIALELNTNVSAGSVEAALRGAGAAIRAVDLVMEGRANTAFAAVRPPGHHAEPDRAMGFCLFNNVAIAAQHALTRWGVQRIAVADFDVHHGNGTQAAFFNDPDLFFASSHQSPLYPGTGRRDERGIAGNIANAPLPAGTGGDGFRKVWARDLLPAIDAFGPDLLIISAGFDGHASDPLAQLVLAKEDFAWLTRHLLQLARKHAGGKVVSVLEGGYDLAALAESAVAHVEALDAQD